jgi:Icc-related predicted phosphoesterase
MMPRLWIMSDLHLEAVAFPEAFRPVPPEFDVLVVAGDVCEGDTDGALRKVRNLANDKPAVFVLGNHEFWEREVARERSTARRPAKRHGVVLLDDGVADVAGLRFVGGTLWADGALAGDAATPELPTGELIRVGSSRRPITGADEECLHQQTLRLIRKVTTEDGPPLVVVTHHAPHPLCLPEAHRCGWAAGNAASDLSALTDSGRIAVWVHGHVHHGVDLVRPGGTRIVCNPAGPGFTNPSFREDLVVAVSPDRDCKA